MTANAVRGEATLVIGGATLRLRPSFAALVAAEAELGPLFALVERAAAGGLTLTELAGLFWHCLDAVPATLSRAEFSDALVAGGLATATPALRVLLGQVLAGR
ncbi:GTA-gp10 family protein [Sandarakinorhabdus sp. DWP1-3-1]|uniref:GTA-gp10 family protein n=1 Tax=Sandarakinorhabdus sp. DWP1-3-1 TaxID=2804627 RepID=UPI003CF81578